MAKPTQLTGTNCELSLGQVDWPAGTAIGVGLAWRGLRRSGFVVEFLQAPRAILLTTLKKEKERNSAQRSSLGVMSEITLIRAIRVL